MTAKNSSFNKVHPILKTPKARFVVFMICVYAALLGNFIKDIPTALQQIQNAHIYQWLGYAMYLFLITALGVFTWLHSVHYAENYTTIATSGFGVPPALKAFFVSGTLIVSSPIAQTVITPTTAQAQNTVMAAAINHQTNNDPKICEGMNIVKWEELSQKPKNIWTSLQTFAELIANQKPQVQYYVGVECNAKTCQTLAETVSQIKEYYNIELAVYKLKPKDQYFILIATTKEAEIAAKKTAEIANNGLSNASMKTIKK